MKVETYESKVKLLPKDAIFVGTSFGIRARATYYSPSSNKFYVAMTFPGIRKGFDVFTESSLAYASIVPRGFYRIRGVKPKKALKEVF